MNDVLQFETLEEAIHYATKTFVNFTIKNLNGKFVVSGNAGDEE